MKLARPNVLKLRLTHKELRTLKHTLSLYAKSLGVDKPISDLLRRRLFEWEPELEKALHELRRSEKRYDESHLRLNEELKKSQHEREVLDRSYATLTEGMRREFETRLRAHESEIIMVTNMMAFYKLALVRRGLLKVNVEERKGLEKLVEKYEEAAEIETRRE